MVPCSLGNSRPVQDCETLVYGACCAETTLCWPWPALLMGVSDLCAGPQYNEPENAMFRYNPRVACVHYDGLEALGALMHLD